MESLEKDLRVIVRIKNNYLCKIREHYGLSMEAAAKKCKISYGCWCALENLKRYPYNKRGFEWSESAVKISKAFNMPPEILFPQALEEITNNKAEREMSAASFLLDSSVETLLLEQNPETKVTQDSLRRQVQGVLSTLSPREQKVIAMRFGLDGDGPKTFDEIGEVFNIGRERVRQIEAKAFRMLRHPSRIKQLKVFLDYWGDVNGDEKPNMTKELDLSESNVKYLASINALDKKREKEYKTLLKKSEALKEFNEFFKGTKEEEDAKELKEKWEWLDPNLS